MCQLSSFTAVRAPADDELPVTCSVTVATSVNNRCEAVTGPRGNDVVIAVTQILTAHGIYRTHANQNQTANVQYIAVRVLRTKFKATVWCSSVRLSVCPRLFPKNVNTSIRALAPSDSSGPANATGVRYGPTVRRPINLFIFVDSTRRQRLDESFDFVALTTTNERLRSEYKPI